MSGIKGWMEDDIRNDAGMTAKEAEASGQYASIVTTMPIPQQQNSDSFIVNTQNNYQPSLQQIQSALDGSKPMVESPNQTSLDTLWNVLASQSQAAGPVPQNVEETHIDLLPIILAAVAAFILFRKRG